MAYLGIDTIRSARHASFAAQPAGDAVAFVVGFYALLVGGKIAMALAIAGGRRYLTDTWYRRLLVGTGALLCIFGLLLLWQLALQR